MASPPPSTGPPNRRRPSLAGIRAHRAGRHQWVYSARVPAVPRPTTTASAARPLLPMLAIPPVTPLDLTWRMLDTRVRVHPIFWVVTALLGSGAGSSFQSVVIWVLVVFVSILLHEFGHVLMARHFGARHLEIVLHGWGGLAIGAGSPVLRHEVLILLGGVFAGLPLGLAALALYFSPWITPATPPVVQMVVGDLMVVNLFWGAVNLLPVYPLDGGQVAAAILAQRRPGDGFGLAMRLSIGVAGAVVAIGLVAHQFLLAVMFAYLAYLSWVMLQNHTRGGDHEPPTPWGRPDDWWRR